MKDEKNMLRNFKHRGTAAVPTALLVGLVSIVALVAVQGTGDNTNELFTSVARTISNDVSGGRKDLPGNDAPEFVNSSISVTVLEDSGAVNLSSQLAVNDPDQDQTLTWTGGASTSNGTVSGLPATASTGFGGNHSPGSVGYTPDADANGSDSFSISVSDGGGSDSVSVSITITPVNDKPSITLGSNQSSTVGDGGVTVNSFATGFSAGPADESGQSIADYLVSEQSDPNNVVSAVDIDNAGNLSYTVSGSNSGTATIQVQVQDDGGTADGGVDTSDVQTFEISVSTGISYARGRLSAGNRDFIWLLLPANTNYGSVSSYRTLCENAGFSINRMSGNATSSSSWNTASFDAYSNSAYYGSSYCNFFGAGNSQRNNITNFQNFGLPLNTPYRFLDRGCGAYGNSHLRGLNTTDRITITGSTTYNFQTNYFGSQDYTTVSASSQSSDSLMLCMVP
ncbi:MAG: hypothetical protein Alpg2KO_02850 [Alphaproteobacteria bacterium]